MEATRQQIQRKRIIQRIDALNMSAEDRQFTLDTLKASISGQVSPASADISLMLGGWGSCPN